MKSKFIILLITIFTIIIPFVANAQKKQKKSVVAEGIKPGDLPSKIITHQDPPQGSVTIYGPYSTVNSIRNHECPEWFRDAKFGMFIDWGIYSVPGWAKQPTKEGNACYPDWYLHDMVFNKSVKEYHEQTWGQDFMPDDFIPMFTAENYEPEKLVQLAAEAGMKYIVPFCKHHDGFCLWPSSYTGRDAMDMGPRKDLVRPLVDECSRLGMKFGVYFSVEEWCTPMIINGEKKIVTIDWGKHGIHPWNPAEIKNVMSGKYFIDGDDYNDYQTPQAKEFIDKYDPDILWFDGEWHYLMEEIHTPEIISYFYNKAQGRKEVAVNDRNGRSRLRIGDFFCSEYHSIPNEIKLMHPWEENRSISRSFGYNRSDTEENILSADGFIDLFTRTVSENGNLLLIVNLDGKGALPEMQASRLREIGKWLKVNGEAIYDSRPWTVTNLDEGKIRFTQSKDKSTVYAICTDFPDKELVLKYLYLTKDSKITMLGAENIELEWKAITDRDHKFDVAIQIPESLYANRKNEYAWVFKIKL
ncbi:MAG: alpha-L-fucosidase [Prevotellaceae bacterium]|jgi:alpha-L-fucosidase|nr:alpha-L-fucosidase [Prevotellaceae bacterium]